MKTRRLSDDWSEYDDHAELVKIEDANLELQAAGQRLRRQVLLAREKGVTWAKIGAMLNTTRQAAEQRFSE